MCDCTAVRTVDLTTDQDFFFPHERDFQRQEAATLCLRHYVNEAHATITNCTEA